MHPRHQGPGWGAGPVPSPPLAPPARGGLSPPPGRLSAGEPSARGASRGSARHGPLPGKMCSSPAVFPPASLFLSTHLFSFSSRLYLKDDVRPSTSLPSPPLASPPPEDEFHLCLETGQETINIYGYQGKVEL